jgi:hypothetical protein
MISPMLVRPFFPKASLARRALIPPLAIGRHSLK